MIHTITLDYHDIYVIPLQLWHHQSFHCKFLPHSHGSHEAWLVLLPDPPRQCELHQTFLDGRV